MTVVCRSWGGDRTRRQSSRRFTLRRKFVETLFDEATDDTMRGKVTSWWDATSSVLKGDSVSRRVDQNRYKQDVVFKFAAGEFAMTIVYVRKQTDGATATTATPVQPGDTAKGKEPYQEWLKYLAGVEIHGVERRNSVTAE